MSAATATGGVLLDLPTGTLVAYTFIRDGLTTTVVGRKGQPVNAHLGRDHGIDLLAEDGSIVATVSRYAHVQVVAA